MLKRIVIVVGGIIYDVIMALIIILFIPVSFLFKTTNTYRLSRNSFIKIYQSIKNKQRNAVIFYCSSVGEFEQAIPLIKKFEEDKKNSIIFFHSKNGLDHCHAISNYTAYLTPYDSFISWLLLIKKIKPEFFIINRHEFWPGAILAASYYSKLYLVNFIIKSKTPVLYNFVIFLSEKVFCVNENNNQNNKMIFSGDSRVDRLRGKYNEKKEEIDRIKTKVRERLKREEKLVVLGNVYTEDLKILFSNHGFYFTGYKFLIVPARNSFDTSLFPAIKKVNDIEALNWHEESCIILNSYGNLFELYSCADIAWIGGGFNKGIHNCLEANFYQIPLICGPNLNEQPDALFLKKENTLHIFETTDQLKNVLETAIVTNKTIKPINDYSPTNYIYKLLNENNNTC